MTYDDIILFSLFFRFSLSTVDNSRDRGITIFKSNEAYDTVEQCQAVGREDQDNYEDIATHFQENYEDIATHSQQSRPARGERRGEENMKVSSTTSQFHITDGGGGMTEELYEVVSGQ